MISDNRKDSTKFNKQKTENTCELNTFSDGVVSSYFGETDRLADPKHVVIDNSHGSFAARIFYSVYLTMLENNELVDEHSSANHYLCSF